MVVLRIGRKLGLEPGILRALAGIDRQLRRASSARGGGVVVRHQWNPLELFAKRHPHQSPSPQCGSMWLSPCGGTQAAAGLAPPAAAGARKGGWQSAGQPVQATCRQSSLLRDTVRQCATAFWFGGGHKTGCPCRQVADVGAFASASVPTAVSRWRNVGIQPLGGG